MESIFDNNHYSSVYLKKLDILLLQLLYESQNTTLCQVLAQSMKNHSLCLHNLKLSLFDRLCLSHFLNNSNILWNHLDLSNLYGQQVQILTNALTNNSQHNQCKILEVKFDRTTNDSVYKLLELSFLHNIQECYCILFDIPVDLCLVILHLLNLPLIKVLHLLTEYLPYNDESTNSTEKYSELETCIAMNSTLLEIVLDRIPNYNPTVSLKTISSLINGITRNKKITSFSLGIDSTYLLQSDGTIENLLKDNHTLQTLKLNIPYDPRESSLNIVEVNTPLTTLEIGSRGYDNLSFKKFESWYSNELSRSLLSHTKGLHCIKLNHPYQPHRLFCSHPSLQQLDLTLYTSESVIDLFTILKSNTTLKSLKVFIQYTDITDSMCTSLQNMFTLNKTIKHLEIECDRLIIVNASTYLSSLITGLSHNTTLQELRIYIPVSDTNEQIRSFFNVISQKNHLTELTLDFVLVQSLPYSNRLFTEQLLPLVTNMLESHTTIRLLKITRFFLLADWCLLINCPIQHLLQAIFLHPSLEYISIAGSNLLKDILKAQEMTLIDQHKKQYPLKPLPIIEF